jgi:DNA-binding LacI/PurR family transcriptional regulator
MSNESTTAVKTRNRSSKKQNLVRNWIMDRIDRGIYTGKLPGVSRLAEELSVNPLTVSRALDTLYNEGIVEKKSRIGTFVRNKKRLALVAFQSEGEPSSDHAFNVPSIYHAMLDGLESATSRHQISILPYRTHINDKDFINFIKREVDGILVLIGGIPELQLNRVLSGVPWVKIMGSASYPAQANVVSYDNDIIGNLAADWLIEHECDEYYYFGGSTKVLFEPRLKSFQARMQSHGVTGGHLDLDIAQLVLEDLVDSAREEFARIMTPGKKIGLFLSADIYCVPIYQLLYSMGHTPMKDVPIISCNNNKLALRGLYPSPAVIDIRMPDIGSRAVDLLMNMINDEHSYSGEHVVLTPELIPVKE